MANFGPIQVPSNLSNLKNLTEVVRFLSAFSSQVASQFNGFIATKTVWGVVGANAGISYGSGNFGASLYSTGVYWIGFQVPYSIPPAVSGIPNNNPYLPYFSGITNTGFYMNLKDTAGTLVNNSFSFIAIGGR